MISKDYGYYYTLPQTQYAKEICLWYKKHTQRELNIEKPKTLFEKIQWLKLYDSMPVKARLADKYLVREWVAQQIGQEYLIPLLGVWDSFDEIDYDALPDQFVMKLNHSSHDAFLVENREIRSIIKKNRITDLEERLRRRYGFKAGFEIHYNAISPRIIAEERLMDPEGNLLEYRFFCIHGEPRFVMVDKKTKSDLYRSCFDMDWNSVKYQERYDPVSPKPEKPENYDEMCDIARKLSKEFAFVRVDLYNIKGRIYFGEMTFTPSSGLPGGIFLHVDLYYGSQLALPEKKDYICIPPALSVIVKTGENINALRGFLQNMREQMLERLEIICMDEGSSEEVSVFLGEQKAYGFSIKVCDCKEMGFTQACNAALEKAEGDFILFSDCASRYRRNMLLDAVKRISNQMADVMIFDKPEAAEKKKEIYEPQELPPRMLCGAVMERSSMIIRRSLIRQSSLQMPDQGEAGWACFALTALLLSKRTTWFAERHSLAMPETVWNTAQIRTDRAVMLLISEAACQTERCSKKHKLEDWYPDLVFELSMHLMRRYGKDRYLQAYDEMRRFGFDRLGLTKLTEQDFADRSRYRRMKAMLGSESVIWFAS